MKLALFVMFLCCNASLSAQQLKFGGKIDYTQQTNKNLSSTNNIEYKIKLYEHSKFSVSLFNALSVDLDCFKNEIKETNVFTTLQIEF
jgi:hypothetical protein